MREREHNFLEHARASAFVDAEGASGPRSTKRPRRVPGVRSLALSVRASDGDTAAEADAWRGTVGESRAWARVRDEVRRVALHDWLFVLITGESGTGKEATAWALVQQGPRRNLPFVPVNCAALPESLAEAELFGHERGAFTGASYVRRGLVEQANGGTLFLDEVGDMSLTVQAKFLRLLQQREVVRLGSSGAARPITVNLRIVAATNKDLLEECRAGRFRLDLYERLAGYELRLPPLRERGKDINLIAEKFLAEKLPDKRLCRSVKIALSRHSWPGNVRELQRVVITAGLRTGRDGVIRLHHLPDDLRRSAAMPEADAQSSILSLARRPSGIRPVEVRTTLSVSRATAYRRLEQGRRQGELLRHGRGRGVYYSATNAVSLDVVLNERQERALAVLSQRPRMTRQDYETVMGVLPRTAKRDLAHLVTTGRLRTEGRGKRIVYVLVRPLDSPPNT